MAYDRDADLNADFPEWSPATMDGVQGAAKHVKGDVWRFAWMDGDVFRERDVFRTRVDVRPVARRTA